MTSIDVKNRNLKHIDNANLNKTLVFLDEPMVDLAQVEFLLSAQFHRETQMLHMSGNKSFMFLEDYR